MEKDSVPGGRKAVENAWDAGTGQHQASGL